VRGDDAEVVAAGQRESRTDVRTQRAHGALQLGGRPRRVQRTVRGLDLVRVRDARLVLLDVRRPLIERAHEQVAAEPLEPRGERAVVVVGRDRLGLLQAYGARVQALGHPHDRDAGLGVARHDRPLDGRRAAPARQQRRVHVDHLVAGQQRLLDQHAEGAHARHLELGGGDAGERLVVVEPLRLDHVEPELASPDRDRRRRELAAAAARPVRPRHHERRAVRALHEPLEHGRRERRRPEVDGPHRERHEPVRR
jgi:hypothetical protein